MRRVCIALVLAIGTWFGAVASPASAAADPRLGEQWGLHMVGAQQAWAAGATGSGVTIAVVDTGVDPDHEDLRGKVVMGKNFVGSCTAQDDHGHGTHVAGIAAATAGNGVGGAGVAPGASILAVKVLDSDGSGSEAAEGIRYAVDRGAKVINLSLGDFAQAVLGPSFSEAIRYAWSKGAISVVAAGNDFVLGSGFSDEPAIVVSATTRQDRKAAYSSGVGAAMWGLAAPGDRVVSTYPGNRYAVMSGTSMAAPHVSGAAAALLSMGLTPDQTVERLLDTAKDLGPRGTDSTYGFGRLDLAAAVNASSGANQSAPGSGDQPAPGGGVRIGDVVTVNTNPGPSSGGVTVGAGPVGVGLRPAAIRAVGASAARSDHTGPGCSTTNGTSTGAEGASGAPGTPTAKMTPEDLNARRIRSDGALPGGTERPWFLIVLAALSLIAVAGATVQRQVALAGRSR